MRIREQNSKFCLYKSLGLLALNLLCLVYANGQFSRTETFTYTQFPDAAINTPAYPSMVPQPTVDKSNLHIKVDMGENYSLGLNNGGDELEFDLALEITVREKKGNTVMMSSDAFELPISNSSPEALYVYNIVTHPKDLDNIEVNVSYTGTISDVGKNNIRLTLECRMDYLMDVNKSKTEKHSCQTLAPDINGRYVNFKWNCNHFRDYQIQILRLYNLDVDKADNTKAIKTKLDWHKALNIDYTLPLGKEETMHSFEMAVAGGSGFYAWRVRPVGNNFPGGVADLRNLGNWSNTANESEMFEVNENVANTQSYLFMIDDPDENINWQYSRVFTEDNLMSETMNYVDGLNKQHQTQTHYSNDDPTLITQTIYDHVGRPALVTMPVPSTGGIENYKTMWVTHNGQPYTAQNFDDDTKIKDPDQMKIGEGTDYYSNENPDLRIPDAGGYPYSRTRFYNDNTNRPAEVSAPGATHAIGQQDDGMGRTVRTFYSNPSEEELIRVFGDEAPAANTVIKTTTLDQNNTASITYTSKEGNVIATAYEISNDIMLLNDDLHDDDLKTITLKVEDNTLTGSEFYSSKKIAFSDDTEVDIKYNVDCPQLAKGCGSFTIECGFELMIYIKNIDTDESYRLNEPRKICGSGSTNDVISSFTWVDNEGDEHVGVGKLTLGKGTWVITKEVKATGKDDFEDNLSVSLNRNAQTIEPLLDVFYGWLDKVKDKESLQNFVLDVRKFSKALEKGKLNNNYSGLLYPEVPYKLGRVSIDRDFEFHTEETHPGYTPHQVILTPDFNPETTTIEDYMNNGKTPMIKIKGGCCGDIEIPCQIPVTLECLEPDEYRDKFMELYESGDPEYAELTPVERHDKIVSELIKFWQFMDYTIKPLYDNDPEKDYKTDFLDKHAYGYTEEEFNTMLFYMMTDKYYTGQIEYKDIDDDGILDAVDPITGNPVKKEVNYTCDEIKACWTSTIESAYDVVKGLVGDGITTVHQGAKENKGEEDKDKDEHFMDAIDEELSWVMRLFISKSKIKDKIHDAEGVKSDDGSGEPHEYEFNVFDQFFDCAGRKFKAIVDQPLSSDLDDVMPEDLEDYEQDPENPMPWKFRFPYDGDIHKDFGEKNLQLDFPYMKNNVYAYKYFSYDGDYWDYTEGANSGDTRNPRYLSAEVDNCYENTLNGMYKVINSETKQLAGDVAYSELCDIKCGTTTNENWSSAKRFNFYTQLINKKKPRISNTVIQADYNELTKQYEGENNELKAKADEIFNELEEKCNISADANKVNLIQSSVEQAFIDNCFIIGGCPGDDNVILPNEVADVASTVITKIQDECDELFNISGWPQDVGGGCYIIHPNGKDLMNTAGLTNYQILPEDKLKRYTQLMDWNFVFALPDAESKCECEDDFEMVDLDPIWKKVYNDNWNKSFASTLDGDAILHSRGNADNAYAAIYRDDFFGDFEVSVTIENSDLLSSNGKSGIMLTNNIESGLEADLFESYVELVAEPNGSGAKIILRKYDGGSLSLISEQTVSQLPCRIKLKRSNYDGETNKADIKAEYSTDFSPEIIKHEEITWDDLGSKIELANTAENPRVGLFTIAYDENTPIETRFDDFYCGKYYPNQYNGNNQWTEGLTPEKITVRENDNGLGNGGGNGNGNNPGNGGGNGKGNNPGNGG